MMRCRIAKGQSFALWRFGFAQAGGDSVRPLFGWLMFN
jgi:hypothetical protein